MAGQCLLWTIAGWERWLGSGSSELQCSTMTSRLARFWHRETNQEMTWRQGWLMCATVLFATSSLWPTCALLLERVANVALKGLLDGCSPNGCCSLTLGIAPILHIGCHAAYHTRCTDTKTPFSATPKPLISRLTKILEEFPINANTPHAPSFR